MDVLSLLMVVTMGQFDPPHYRTFI